MKKPNQYITELEELLSETTLTDRELASKMKVSPMTIWRWRKDPGKMKFRDFSNLYELLIDQK